MITFYYNFSTKTTSCHVPFKTFKFLCAHRRIIPEKHKNVARSTIIRGYSETDQNVRFRGRLKLSVCGVTEIRRG